MKTTMIALAALAASVGGSVQAATIVSSGSYAAGGGVTEDASIGLGPGLYRFILSVTSPVVESGSYAQKQANTDFFCDYQDGAGEVGCGGNVATFQSPFAQGSPTSYESLIEVYPAHGGPLGTSPFTRFVESETCCDVHFAFASQDDGEYTLSVGAVPEPATWALMIAGFGAAGAALRRPDRRRVQVGWS